LTILAACVTQGASPERAAFGNWRVSSSMCPSECAMSPAEASAWRGRSATYENSVARFAGNSCQHPRYNVDHWPANGRYGGTRLADVGVTGDSALVIEVQCPSQSQTRSDPRWQVPGAFLIVKDHNHLLAIWEGVFFELTRQ
jgi:hypothetical protein